MARAKFVVTVVSPLNNVRLMPVLTESPENKAFFKQPTRGIVLENLTDETMVQFKEGQQVFVDFSPAS